MQKRLKKKSLENAMEVTCKQKWVNIKSYTVQNTEHRTAKKTIKNGQFLKIGFKPTQE